LALTSDWKLSRLAKGQTEPGAEDSGLAAGERASALNPSLRVSYKKCRFVNAWPENRKSQTNVLFKNVFWQKHDLNGSLSTSQKQ
jgi:hypothetical protein